MKREIERVRRLLPNAIDPAAASVPLGESAQLSERAERELTSLRLSAVAEAGGASRSRPGRRIVLTALVASAAAGAVVSGGMPWPGSEGEAVAHAATPPVLSLTPVKSAPQDFLQDFATRVAKLPGERVHGPYGYTKVWGWALNTSGDVPGGVANAAVPEETESWVKGDASGRRRIVYGDPIFPNLAQEKDARDAQLIAGKKIEDTEYGRGKFPSPESDAWKDVAPFSASPKKLARQLGEVNWESGLLVKGVEDMLRYAGRSGPVAPALRAAALQVLAEAQDVSVATTTTWQGQEVVAVTQGETWKGSTSRQSVLFDPRTGDLVGSEDALFGNARALRIKVPATTSVSEVLARATVGEIGERPKK
ncbi:hypothetical protein [Streptomyces sp. NBC_00258]|uniref:hypothetical protein n=1 Tax=Streptomyces sp. NBC_00258 TaxID=2903642 RepID=UPI002E2BDCEE|nr:hypothetical protein [Streptomyces sp. NBC_00258]